MGETLAAYFNVKKSNVTLPGSLLYSGWGGQQNAVLRRLRTFQTSREISSRAAITRRLWYISFCECVFDSVSIATHALAILHPLMPESAAGHMMDIDPTLLSEAYLERWSPLWSCVRPLSVPAGRPGALGQRRKEWKALRWNLQTFVFPLLGMCERVSRWTAAEGVWAPRNARLPHNICPAMDRSDYPDQASAGPPTAAAVGRRSAGACAAPNAPAHLHPVWALIYRSKHAQRVFVHVWAEGERRHEGQEFHTSHKARRMPSGGWGVTAGPLPD